MMKALFAALAVAALGFAYKYANPAPPHTLVLATGDGEGDYQTYAKMYRDIIKQDGVDVVLRPTQGASENLKLLQDPKSGVDAGFAEDGLGSVDDQPDVSSLGSLYYEPLWIFTRAGEKVRKLSELAGKRVSLGEKGSGIQPIVADMLKASGIDEKTAKIVRLSPAEAADSLRRGKVDAIFLLAAPDDETIDALIRDPRVSLLSLAQAEAIARQYPHFHHLVLPRGALDLKDDLPRADVDMIAPTATLLVRDSLHPALMYLLLKAATAVHNDAGIFEHKNEFPVANDNSFPLTEEARAFYKSGTPFWQRYLPFWLATIVERFLVLVIPALAIVIPIVKLIPQYFAWRLKSRFFARYGELKALEAQIGNDLNHQTALDYLKRLDAIEERVNAMKVPLDFTDQIYGLRQNIHFVRSRLERLRDGLSPAAA